MAPRKSATVKKVVEREVQPGVVSEEVVEVPVPTEKKYRCDFKTWKEYAAYKGPKG